MHRTRRQIATYTAPMGRAIMMLVMSQVACGRGSSEAPNESPRTMATAPTESPGKLATVPDVPTASADDVAFSLVVYADRVGVIYEYDALAAALEKRPPSRMVFQIGPDDVEQLVIGPRPSARYNLVLGSAAAERWRAARSEMGDTAPFEVKLGDARLFVGVIYNPIGAAAIRSPVLHADGGDRTVLVIAAYLGAASGVPHDNQLSARIDSGELRSYFERRGVLKVLAALPPPPPRT